MKRGEVWRIDFEPAAVGGEVRKERPAVIVPKAIIVGQEFSPPSKIAR